MRRSGATNAAGYYSALLLDGTLQWRDEGYNMMEEVSTDQQPPVPDLVEEVTQDPPVFRPVYNSGESSNRSYSYTTTTSGSASHPVMAPAEQAMGLDHLTAAHYPDHTGFTPYLNQDETTIDSIGVAFDPMQPSGWTSAPYAAPPDTTPDLVVPTQVQPPSAFEQDGGADTVEGSASINWDDQLTRIFAHKDNTRNDWRMDF